MFIYYYLWFWHSICLNQKTLTKQMLGNNHFCNAALFLGKRKVLVQYKKPWTFTYVFDLPIKCNAGPDFLELFEKLFYFYNLFCESVRMKGMLGDCTQQHRQLFSAAHFLGFFFFFNVLSFFYCFICVLWRGKRRESFSTSHKRFLWNAV